MCEMNDFRLFCKSYLVLCLTFIIGTPILCCAVTDLGIFGTVLGIFDVAFVRALYVWQNGGWMWKMQCVT